MSSTTLEVAESRLPVGSSAKITEGLLISARAITTRCFWPPERSVALFSALSASSSCSKASSPRRLRSAAGTPAIFSGSVTFSSTLWLGVRKNCWNTKPNAELRSSLSSLALRSPVGLPSRATTPWVGPSSSASRCMSVDLPEPDLPTTATDSPLPISRLMPLRASKRVSPLP